MSVGRLLLITIVLSGLCFLCCLLVKPGGYTFYTMAPYPNERTPWPSETELFLMAMRQNPWVAFRFLSLLALIVSSVLGLVHLLYARRGGEVQ